MKKIFLLFLLFLPLGLSAQSTQQEEIFKAKVIEILAEKEIIDESGLNFIQQNLRLKGLSGNFKNQEIVFEGISDFQILSSRQYALGDRVMVISSINDDGSSYFFVSDYDRTNPIILLSFIFIFSVLVIGRWKGFRSLLALIASFLVILKFIIPQILAGTNPVLVSVLGGIFILFFAIYLTQGFNIKAHLANLSLIISLLFTAFLSAMFTALAQLSGYAGEETVFLFDLAQGSLNLQGLLLAGILIGTLGVLDDVIISQVSTVEQIKQANPSLSKKEVYKMSAKVGVDHITSMINTLFFAYAGAALPLLILFAKSDVIGLNLSQAINNEMVATEIIRTLLGSIGIILAIPISNWLASWFLSAKKA
ncbi:YibE/F family protein [Candidatus Nomurabacteria bacterium]|nr:YibE/F family protein [Candidatus Nomurabacteria bacterium]